MPGRTSILFALLFCTASSAPGQTAAEPSQFELGKAAMAAHDPTAAIAHFERAAGKQADAWLAAALMMESRSPSDQFVERAFEAAARSRANDAARLRSRRDVAAALRPGEMVIAFLVGEQHAYAWAFDRDALIGYPLPQPEEIATSVDLVNRYVGQDLREGVQRIADDLVPALLGPVLDRVPELSRVIFVMDGPLRQLPMHQVLGGDTIPGISRLPISIVDDEALFEEVQRPAVPRDVPRWGSVQVTVILTAIAIVLVSLLARRRSRERS
jgi:hypothetical protein